MNTAKLNNFPHWEHIFFTAPALGKSLYVTPFISGFYSTSQRKRVSFLSIFSEGEPYRNTIRISNESFYV